MAIATKVKEKRNTHPMSNDIDRLQHLETQKTKVKNALLYVSPKCNFSKRKITDFRTAEAQRSEGKNLGKGGRSYLKMKIGTNATTFALFQ